MKCGPIWRHPFEACPEGISQKTPQDGPPEFILKKFFRYHSSEDNKIFSSPLAGEDDGEGEPNLITPTLSLPRQGGGKVTLL